MPKAKRAKLVSLTQTEKKTRDQKEADGDEIRECADTFAYIWIFGVENMRNTFLKDIRQDWKGSRIFYGRNKTLQKVLGRTPEEEHRPNLHKITKYINGEVGLLMTDEEPTVVKEYFDAFVKTDFARAGLVAPFTVEIPEGIVYSTGGQLPEEEDVPMAHSLESAVRQLGMPTRLKAGKVVLDGKYTLCKEGQTLNSKQTQLLKQFGIATAEFKVKLIAVYDRDNETVKRS